MTAAPKWRSPPKLPCGGSFARRTRLPWGETGVLGEEADKRSRGARRGMGPSTYARIAEIMSGRAIAQQGLATTCKDRAHNANSGGAGRAVVWRMSPYERRRGGNAPPGGLRGRPGAGNARSGQRGSGHSVAAAVGYAPDLGPGYAGPAAWRRGEANSTAAGRRVRQHRSFARWGKARPEKWREPRSEPDSGKPTVRDRRGASGNVASWSMISTRRARLISISTNREGLSTVAAAAGGPSRISGDAPVMGAEPRGRLVRGWFGWPTGRSSGGAQ